MLRELRIVNLALIEKLHIALPAGLIVLTGETGAGKSIILQAIHLLSGGRAGAGWIRAEAETASVEALFTLPPEHAELQEHFREQGLEMDEEIIIKRVLAKNSSRFYINGGLATAKLAGEVTEHLLSVASQHDHQQLLSPRAHLDFIDALGSHGPQRRRLGELYDQWQNLAGEVRLLQEQERDKEQRRDFLSFQCREIEEARLEPEEEETLLRAKEKLKASATLTRLGRESHELLAGVVMEHLGQLRKNLEQMAGFDPELAGLAEQVAAHGFELEEHLTRLRDYVEEIPSDPGQLEKIMARLDLLQRLKRKYGGTVAEVLAHGCRARQELQELEELDSRVEELQGRLAGLEQQLVKAAGELSAARRRTGAALSETISREIQDLCLEQARFSIGFGEGQPGLAELTRSGWDLPEFLFSANPGEPLKPLAKVGSGGELSRLMLALKCVLARRDQVETVIFDEVDAGISGKAAEAVARKIRELAGHHQVLCITHLPQIASMADAHYLVDKMVASKRTYTTIARLSDRAKVDELARMLDGSSVTNQTLAYARELLDRNRKLGSKSAA